jgi:NAD(P)H-dependent FMN reductase
VQMLKQVVSTLKMMPLPEAVVLPSFQQHLDDDGRFAPKAPESQAADVMLNELLRWSSAMAVLR